MARVADALDHYVDRLMAEGVSRTEDGDLILRLAVFAAAPLEIRLRLLSRLLQTVGGGTWPARSQALERLEAAFGQDQAFKRTLAGTIIRKTKESARFRGEPGRAAARRQKAGAGIGARPTPPVHLPVGAGA
jgi:hypothetical protein